MSQTDVMLEVANFQQNDDSWYGFDRPAILA